MNLVEKQQLIKEALTEYGANRILLVEGHQQDILIAVEGIEQEDLYKVIGDLTEKVGKFNFIDLDGGGFFADPNIIKQPHVTVTKL